MLNLIKYKIKVVAFRSIRNVLFVEQRNACDKWLHRSLVFNLIQSKFSKSIVDS